MNEPRRLFWRFFYFKQFQKQYKCDLFIIARVAFGIGFCYEGYDFLKIAVEKGFGKG